MGQAGAPRGRKVLGPTTGFRGPKSTSLILAISFYFASNTSKYGELQRSYNIVCTSYIHGVGCGRRSPFFWKRSGVSTALVAILWSIDAKGQPLRREGKRRAKRVERVEPMRCLLKALPLYELIYDSRFLRPSDLDLAWRCLDARRCKVGWGAQVGRSGASN